MIDFDHWIDRLDNEMQLQKYSGDYLVRMMFTNREIIELKMMIETLRDMIKEQKDEINSKS